MGPGLANRSEMRTKQLFFGLILLIAGLGAQSDPGAELEKRLAAAAAADKLPVLTELCRLHLRTDPARVLEYGGQAERLLQQYPDAKTELLVLDLICQANLYQGDYDRAQSYGEKSLDLAERMNYRKGIGVALGALANIHIQKGDYAKSRDFSARAGDIFRASGEKKPLASILNSIGISYDMQGNYEKALDYYLQSLKIKEELGDKDMISRSLNNIGVIYQTMGNSEAALQYYTRALQIKEEIGDRAGIASQYINLGNVHEIDQTRDIAKAVDYYRRALALYRELDNQPGIASALFNIGWAEEQSGNYRPALDFYRQALELRQKMGEKESVAQTLIQLGSVYNRLGRHDQAQRTLEQGLALAGEIDAQSHIQNGKLYLSEALEAKRDYAAALRCYKEYKKAADTLFNSESSKKIAELQARFDSEKQEQEIVLLRKNNEIQQLKLNRQKILRNLMIAGFALLISAALFLLYRYRYLITFWKKKNYIGHYRIIEQMGSGGMGTVYRATDVVDPSHRSLAVKVLREEFFSDEVQKKRFKQEASIIDQVVHAHIVRVIERGETDSGLYIAMEVLQGPSLSEFIAGQDRVPVGLALHIMIQISDALKSIHAMNIVHRDLKPDNIKLIEKDGDRHFVKLLDFGLAITGSMNRLTETGIVVGTIFYLAPEQIAGQAISTASDIHSLGVIFYEMLTGSKPFGGETTLDVMKQIINSEPIEIRTFRPDLDRMLADLVMLMLRKDPRQRPTAAMIHDVLRSLAASMPGGAK